MLKKPKYVGHIVVKHHCIDRFKTRQGKDFLDDKVVIQKIIGQVRLSKLISLKGKEEHRSYNGYIYVCKREGKNLVVVTMKNSTTRKRDLLSRFDLELLA